MLRTSSAVKIYYLSLLSCDRLVCLNPGVTNCIKFLIIIIIAIIKFFADLTLISSPFFGFIRVNFLSIQSTTSDTDCHT